MKGSFLPALAFAVLAAAASPVRAEPSALAAIREAGVIRIGTTGDYKPFTYRTAAGDLTGADIDMARDLAAHLGVRAAFVPTTWKTLLDDFKAGKFDMAVGGISVNPARAEAGNFSIATLSDGKRPIVRCADKDRYVSLAAIDQPSVHVVVNPGGTNDTFAHEHFARAPIEVYPDNKTIFEEIVAGKADVMVSDGVEVDLQARLHPGVLCPAAVTAPFTHDEKAYLLRRDPALKAAVDAWLRQELDAGGWRKHLDAAMH